MLQDAAKFGLKSWVIPIAILCLGWRGTKKAWQSEKQFHEIVMARNFPGGYEPKLPWLWAVIAILAVIALSFFVLQDRTAKLSALKKAEYTTFQGYIADIYRVDTGRTAWAKSRLNFKITGQAIDPDGRQYALNRYNDRVTTKRSVVADWGGNCSGPSCGLSIGDKVRIKHVAVNTYYGGDTLSIEKCEMP